MNNTHINYQEYLESYAWKALKKTKLDEQSDCECCGAPATSIHHLSYERLGREKPEDIVSICERCHEECHHIGGYQIKNDEEILRRRFEEVKNTYLGESEVEFIHSGEDFFLNGEKLERLANLSIDIVNYHSRDNDENQTIRLLLRSEKYIYSVQSYSSGESDSGGYYDEDEGYSSTPENDGSWHPAYEGYGGDDYDEHESIDARNNLIGMTVIWDEGDGGPQWSFGENLSRIHIDSDSFEIIHIGGESNIYFKDKNNVYYNFCVVKGADPKSFKKLDKGLSMDKSFMYFQGGIIKDSDSSTFERLNDKYSKDKNNVYYDYNKIDGSDGLTFEILNVRFSKDKNYVYEHFLGKHRKIESVDSKSFEILSDGYSKDKNYVYYMTLNYITKIEGANSLKFKFLGGNSGSDEKNIYIHGEKKEYLHTQSFRIISENYTKDKNGVYYYAKTHQSGILEGKIEGADIETFEVIDDKHGKDKYSVYHGSRVLGIYSYNKQTLEYDIFEGNPDPIFFTKDNIVSGGYSNYILKK